MYGDDGCGAGAQVRVITGRKTRSQLHDGYSINQKGIYWFYFLVLHCI